MPSTVSTLAPHLSPISSTTSPIPSLDSPSVGNHPGTGAKLIWTLIARKPHQPPPPAALSTKPSLTSPSQLPRIPQTSPSSRHSWVSYRKLSLLPATARRQRRMNGSTAAQVRFTCFDCYEPLLPILIWTEKSTPLLLLLWRRFRVKARLGPGTKKNIWVLYMALSAS